MVKKRITCEMPTIRERHLFSSQLACMLLAALCAGDTLAEERPYAGEVSIDYLFVENPNGKFGEYNGLNDDKSNLVLNLDASGRDLQAPERSWKLDIHNLGLDTFFVEGEYKNQGRFAIRAGYEELQKIYHDDALTPFDDAYNTLPFPRELTTLTERETASAGFDLLFRERFKFTTDLRTQTKEGQRPRPIQPAAFILPQAIDFEHDELEAALAYSDKQLSWRVGSRFSEFENANRTVLTHAAEPDNDFYQLYANGTYRLSDSSQATAYLSYSEASQDEDISDYPGSSVAVTSADAEYSNVNFQIGYQNRLTRKISFDAKYRYETRDNDTPLYSGFASNKNNIVYEWDKQKIDLKATYRMPQRWRLQGGLTWTDDDRTSLKEPVPSGSGYLTQYENSLTDRITEWTGWGQLRSPQFGSFSGQLKLALSDRSTDLDPVREQAATSNTNGVALSSYLDARERTEIDLLLNQVVTETVNASFNVRYVDDDYDGTAWNSLDRSRSTTYTFDVNYVPHRDYSLAFYAGVEDFEIEQSGFSSLGNAATSWQYSIDDQSRLFGITAKALGVSSLVDLTFDYSYQKASGDYQNSSASGSSAAFPDLDSAINRLSIEADFHIDDRLTINTQYLYESYDFDSWVWRNDFGLSGGYYNTLNYGYDVPNDSTHVLIVGLTYRF